MLIDSGALPCRPHEIKVLADAGVVQYMITESAVARTTGKKDEAGVKMEAELTADEAREVMDSIDAANPSTAAPAPKKKVVGLIVAASSFGRALTRRQGLCPQAPPPTLLASRVAGHRSCQKSGHLLFTYVWLCPLYV